MKTSEGNYTRIVMAIFLIGFLTLICVGCTNVQHQVRLDKAYITEENVSIKVGKVVNDTGFDFDIDIEAMLADALEDQLLEEDLLWLGGKEPALLMESRIVEYKKGSAFKRWMMPGWGATELSIRCVLKDDKNNKVGSAVASREVFAGGGYTIGAWETVFKDVANDVAEDLREQIESLGYVVKPKSLPEKSADKPIAAFSPAKVDPVEPWTGVWDVQGSRHMSGPWAMKQSGKIVKSTKDSLYEFKGKVRGNQLKGTILGDNNIRREFVLSLSSDGLRFDGSAGSYLLIGNRNVENTAIIAPVEFNSSEPWTGTWEVNTASARAAGQWVLKQQGNRVKSAGDHSHSFNDFSAKVKGNQLEGRITNRGTEICPIKLKISADGQSFEGTIAGYRGNMVGWIKGKRKK